MAAKKKKTKKRVKAVEKTGPDLQSISTSDLSEERSLAAPSNDASREHMPRTARGWHRRFRGRTGRIQEVLRRHADRELTTRAQAGRPAKTCPPE
jgi:hypothetical protein